MKHKTMLTIVLALAAGGPLHAQSVLRPGDSVTWMFQFEYSSTEAINSPDQPFGGYVMLDYSYIWQAGPLDYRLDFFEDFTSPEPLLSLSVHHLTGLVDQTGAPMIWLPEFSPPPDAWSDLDGIMRLTIVSGEMRDVTPYISMLVPTTPGYMDHYQAVVVPEPSTPGLFGLGGLLFAHRFRRDMYDPASNEQR